MIYNQERARQPVNFDGIGSGKKIPSDIDLIYENQNRWYFIVEIKLAGNDMTGGQKIMLERLAKDIIKTGKKVMVLVAEHQTKAAEIVQAKDCIVVKFYDGVSWKEANKRISVGAAFQWFEKKADNGN